MRLLPARDERLPELAANRLAPIEPQEPRSRGQAEDARRASGDAKPLELDRQRRAIEVRSRAGAGKRLRPAAPAPASRATASPSPASVRSQPSLAPRHPLDRGFASERAAAAVRQGTAAEIDHVGLARRRLDEVGVAGALQRRVGPIARGQHVGIRVQLVRARSDRARPRQGHRVAPAGASFGRDQVVPAVALVEMRRFGEADRRAGEDQVPFADQRCRVARVLLQDDAARSGSFRAGDPTAC